MGKIAILTSGGDASGMNTCIYYLNEKLKKQGYEVFGVMDSYKGLCENKIFPLHLKEETIQWTKHLGGSILRCFRYEPFIDPQTRKIGLENLKKQGINKLIILGGNGSYQGALKLSNEGIQTWFLPLTIDNDLSTTEITIGMSSAVKHIVEKIDDINSTNITHQRISIIEVMGRAKPDITILSGHASAADLILTIDNKLSKEEIKSKILEKYSLTEDRNFLIVMSEMIYDNVEEIRQFLESELKNKCKYNVIGLSQRSPVPDYFDRTYSRLMSQKLVESIDKGSGQITLRNGKVMFSKYDDISFENPLVKECNEELFK